MRPSRRYAAALLVLAAGCRQPAGTTQQAPASTLPATAQTAPAPASTLLATAQTAPAATMPAALPAEPFSGPPAILLRAGGTETALHAWTSCWHSGNVTGCGDGHPPDVPQDLGNAAELEVAFDAPGWRFSATAVPTGEACGGRRQSMDLPATGPTTHRLLPIGKAGDYTMTLNGRSTDSAANAGDVVTTFRWHTPTNGPNEAPSATLSLLATPPEARASLGAELSATALGVSTRAGQAKAAAVVTSSTGASLRLEFQDPSDECMPDGSLFLRSDGEDGRRLATLGPPPFRYDVTLVLGNATYRGTGTWPGDEISACSPCTRLRFDPPLPAL